MKKTKILFLAANPIVTSRLQLDEEIRAITEKIRASEMRDSLELISAWAVRTDDLLQLLNEHKPHIVHFSGHGNSNGELVLADSNGAAKAVSQSAISSLFKILKGNIRVIFLNACFSKTQSEAIKNIVDCTIGMNTSISDQAAIIFAASFYRALGFGLSVNEAFEQGKVAIELEGISEETTPELFCRENIDPTNIFIVRRKRTTSQTQQDTLLIYPYTPYWFINAAEIRYLGKGIAIDLDVRIRYKDSKGNNQEMRVENFSTEVLTALEHNDKCIRLHSLKHNQAAYFRLPLKDAIPSKVITIVVRFVNSKSGKLIKIEKEVELISTDFNFAPF